MKLALVFPPGTDPRAPHLCLPALMAVLRREGVPAQQFDLDLESLLALLRPGNVEAAARRLRDGAGHHLAPERRERLLRLSPRLHERVPEALATLRDPERFLDPHRLADAMADVDVALAVCSAAALTPVEYSIAPVAYDVPGCDGRRLRDVLAVTNESGANLFHDYWEAEALPRIERGDPDLIGISLTNRQQLLPGLMLARRLKQRGAFVVLGGTLISKFADELERWPEFFHAFADGVVVYEGETALLELVEQLQGKRDFSRVPNYRYLDGDRVRATTVHVEDLGNLPTPDFEGLPLDDYLSPRRVLPIYLGKGCYYGSCNFCDIPHINRVSPRRYRRRPPDRVFEDVRDLERRFGAREFVITDESLAPKVLQQLADSFAGHEGRYGFTGYARILPEFTPQLCQRLARLGFRKLYFGLESAEQRTLDHMRKGTRADAAHGVLRNCHEAGLRVHLFTMIGLPEEDERSARATLDFLVSERELLGHPGNSCDVHRFGLDLRAPYYAHRAELGLRVQPRVADQELVVSLGSADWENTRGIPRQRLEALLAEFDACLRLVRSVHHNAPRDLWPPFEEHTLIYAEHYAAKAFPWVTGLPGSPDTSFRLRLSGAAAADFGAGDVTLCSFWHTRTLPERLVRGLLEARDRTLLELVADCVSPATPDEWQRAESALRNLVLQLCSQGILQVEVISRRAVNAGLPLDATSTMARLPAGRAEEAGRPSRPGPAS